jgi:hypothetical protein
LALRRKKILFQLVFVSALVLIAFNVVPSARADEWSQIPTVAIATVTGTPVGAIAIVRDNEQGFVNVRSGPSSVYFDIVGVLVEGSQIDFRPLAGWWIKVLSWGDRWCGLDLGRPGGYSWQFAHRQCPPPQPHTATIDPTWRRSF